MSGGKASGKQADEYTGKQPGEGRFVTSRDTAAAEGGVHAPGHTHRKSTCLEEMSAAASRLGDMGKPRSFSCAAGCLPFSEEMGAHHETSYADATSIGLCWPSAHVPDLCRITVDRSHSC